MKRILHFCVYHPYWILLVLTGITCLAALQIPAIRLDPRAEIFIAEDNPVRAGYESNRSEFASHEETLIGLVGQDVFTRPHLEKIKEISTRAGRIGIVKEVKDLLSMDYIQGSDAGIEVAPLAPNGEIPPTAAGIAALRAKIDAWDFFQGIFVSAEHDGSIISIIMREGTETDDVIPVYYELTKIAAETSRRHPGGQVFITGVPVVEALIGDYMIRDMRVFIPIVNLVIIATLSLLFRNIRGVVLPLLTVGMSTIWALALLARLQWPMTQVTSTLPVMLTAVGTAYGIHVLENVFSDAAVGKRGREGIINAATRVSMPVIMAGLTTMGGFASLATTDVVPIKQLGLIATFGVFAALIISLTFIPAVLAILDGLGREFIPAPHTRRDLVGPVLRGCTFLALRKSTATIIACLIIMAVSIIGLLRIQTDLDPIQSFKKGSPIRVADDYLNAKFAGTSMFNVVIRGGSPDAIKDPAVLKKIEGLQQRLGGIQGVGKAVSIVDLLKRMNQVMHADDPRYYTIPESRELVAQYLLLYSFSGSDAIERFVTNDRQNAQILLLIKSQAGSFAEQIFAAIERYNRDEFTGTGLTCYATGISAITREFNHIVIRGQISSFVLAFILVILVTMPIFKSVKLGLFSILPLGMPILINFGLMGFTGITLNAATAMIASITVGTGIDYSIHFLSRYRHELGRDIGIEAALKSAIDTSGRAILYNALAVAAGFIVLVLSNFVPIIQAGFLTALVMLTSSSAALTILPAVIMKFHPRIRAEKTGNHYGKTIQGG